MEFLEVTFRKKLDCRLAVKRIFVIRIFSLALVVLAVISCGKSRKSEGVISDQTMVDILYESYLFEGYSAITTEYDYRQLDSVTVGYYDALFKKYGTTQEQFDSSVDFYMRNRHLYEDIYNRVIAKIDSVSASGI